MRRLTVLRTGPQTLVQDLGRPGYAHLGVPPSGALDGPALRLANRLVGNPETAAGLEVLLGGLAVRAGASCTVVVTGPPAPVRRNGCAVGSHALVHLACGDVLEVGTPERGLRCYLAVSGGVDVPAELGSRSTDLLSGIGPDPVRDNDDLPLGAVTAPAVGADVLVPTRVPDALVVPVLLGPRDDWFGDPAGQLRAGRWTVSEKSNRVGMRLTGTALERAEGFVGEELPSEGIPTGGVQVPADGQPVVFLADHPTTGGYPVIGVVPADVLPLLAQARPGVPLEFRPQDEPGLDPLFR
ncbi:biotin-dependent carboxyltransferase family protein [Umezawaea endophytica]|uniref:Biotin-dependent carboxyltransferase family protein n=1 Tax=Umezawaea endophytica TaxID=1654476 RepID=A0A9X2VRP5_9PSEU|nr:biotin-dependent carboxyltransferase family protein [Umezawaea endophytica]MCS7480937.1 biotin-dependent carboxyltransferase family protein [Umezawaea endophytica]